MPLVTMPVATVGTTLIFFVLNGQGGQCHQGGQFPNGPSGNVPLTPSIKQFPELLTLASSTLTPQDMQHHQGDFPQQCPLGTQHNFPRSRRVWVHRSSIPRTLIPPSLPSSFSFAPSFLSPSSSPSLFCSLPSCYEPSCCGTDNSAWISRRQDMSVSFRAASLV